jgi:P-loop Domain of unknown function (DUF2791)
VSLGVPGPRGELPGGGGSHQVDEYLGFAAEEYLRTYILGGGAAVKLVVPGSDEVAKRFGEGLAELAAQGGFANAAVDAAQSRIHLMDQLFFAVARQIDWMALAARVLHDAYQQTGFPAAGRAGGQLAVAAVAELHGIDAMELYRSLRRTLESAILADTTLSHEFRVAMLRLCQSLTGHVDIVEADRLTVLSWLTGEKVPVSQLRAVLLYSKITRYNARPLLASLTRWLRKAGLPGLVLRLDLERVAVGRRPPVEQRDGHFYSKPAALDAYELLRQLIDAADDLPGLFVAVLLPPELVTDESRGLPAYSALQLRVADEVRDRNRANPYAALVRLDVRLEAVR